MRFKDFDRSIIKKNVKYSVDTITDIIKTIGPRESGSKEAFAAEEKLKAELEKFADEVHYEEYQMAPRAFLGFTKVVSTGIVGAITAAGVVKKFTKAKEYVPHAIVGAATIGGLSVTGLEFLLYKRFTDGLYKKATGHNLIATRKATEETRKRIIIGGHIDSEYEWRHTYYGGGKLMGPLMGSTIVTSIATAAVSSINAVASAAKIDNSFTRVLKKAALPLYLFEIPNMATLFAFINHKVLSPGANDNLTGTMAAVSALKMLDEAGVRFKYTDVVCHINDGEEAGLRGVKQYAKDHRDEFVNSDVETHVLCVDTLKDLPYLNVYNRDMTGTVRHDQKFSQLVMDAAIEAGHNDLQFANVFFGSSDAAAFTQEGVSATCLAAMDPTPAYYYHNRLDNYDTLDPEAIEVGYDIVLSTILKFADEDD